MENLRKSYQLIVSQCRYCDVVAKLRLITFHNYLVARLFDISGEDEQAELLELLI